MWLHVAACRRFYETDASLIIHARSDCVVERGAILLEEMSREGFATPFVRCVRKRKIRYRRRVSERSLCFFHQSSFFRTNVYPLLSDNRRLNVETNEFFGSKRGRCEIIEFVEEEKE